MRPNGFTRQMKLWRPRHVTKPYQAAPICYSTRELPDSSSNAYHVWLACWVTSRSNTAVSRKVVQQNRTRQCRKVLCVMGFMVFDWGFRCFSDIEGNITNKSIYAFSFLVGKHREPQSINAKLFLPIIPIGIVAYALTLLWDNLCRNSCIHFSHNSSSETEAKRSAILFLRRTLQGAS